MTTQATPGRHWCECSGGHWTLEKPGPYGRCPDCYRLCPAIGGCRVTSTSSSPPPEPAHPIGCRCATCRPMIRHGHQLDPFARPAGARAPATDGWGRPDSQ